MGVRRTRRRGRAQVRATAAAGLLLSTAVLAGCAGAPVSLSVDEPSRTRASASGPAAAEDPSPGEESVSRPPGPAWESASPQAGVRRRLEGGGFARSVPGSDAPDRKVDVGPQYAVGEDLDIEEVERLVRAVEKIAGRQELDQPRATGGSLAAAVGTFSYRWFADGTVQPDPAWVAANIRTEQVPILGSVTGHRVLFPQLRGALREIEARGLASAINPGEFGGCYVPRFIGHDPDNGLSLHTWGIAVDLNVPGNMRGTVGEIDRDVVAIFKKWGFAWGGDWRWTDPMHFELARLVSRR